MSHTSPTSLESLLAHEGWARSLARALVRDGHQADDLVQRAFEAALDRPPAAGTPPRRWLASVMRNLARFDRRSGRHRGDRERSYARPEGTESADHSLRVLESRALLQDALLALPEPYRSAITERYLEERPPREIAQRRGVALKTVKSQLHRGLEMLRKELDERNDGDRSGWVMALVPLLRPEPTTQVLTWKTALVAATLILPIVLLWSLRTPDHAEPGVAASGAFVTTDVERTDVDGAALAARVAMDGADALAGSIEVRVVRATTREPVAGAEIRRWTLPDRRIERNEIQEWFRSGRLESETTLDPTSWTTDPRGRQSISPGEKTVILTASFGSLWGWTTVYAQQASVAVIELEQDGDLRVRVVDVNKQPLPGVRVQLFSSLGYCGEGDEGVEYQFASTQAPDGIATFRHARYWFESADSACKANAQLRVCVAHETPLTRRLDQDELPATPIEIALTAPTGTCDVRIVDARGAVIASPHVVTIQSNGQESFQAHVVDGRLSFPVTLGTRLTARAEASSKEQATQTVDGPTRVGDAIQVVLQRDTSTSGITGRILDLEGQALGRRRFSYFIDVRISNSMPVFETDDSGTFVLSIAGSSREDGSPSTLYLEQLGTLGGIVATARVSLRAQSGLENVGDIAMIPRPLLVEGLVVDQEGRPVEDASITVLEEHALGAWDDPLQYRARTDEQGRFSLCQLERGRDSIAVTARKDGWATASTRSSAGATNLVLTLEQAPVVHGRFLVDPSMKVDRLFVWASRATDAYIPGLIPGYTTNGPLTDFGVECRALAADGSFALHELPLDEYCLRLVRQSEAGPAILFKAERVRARTDSDGCSRIPALDVQEQFYYASVNVQDCDGRPVPGAEVQLISDDPAPAWPGDEGSEFFEPWKCDAEGRCVALVGRQRNRLEVNARGFPSVEVTVEARDVRVILPRFPSVTFALDGAVPALDPGVQLTLLLGQVGPRRDRNSGRYEDCYRHGSAFGADGRLECSTPLLGRSQARIFVVRVADYPKAGSVEEVMDGLLRTVMVVAGEPQTVHIEELNSRAVSEAVARLGRQVQRR